MSTLVTFEKVSAAAQQLQSSGQRPSVRLVIATLGAARPMRCFLFSINGKRLNLPFKNPNCHWSLQLPK